MWGVPVRKDALQQLNQSDNQPALGNQGTKHPFQQIGPEGFNIGFGGQIAVE